MLSFRSNVSIMRQFVFVVTTSKNQSVHVLCVLETSKYLHPHLMTSQNLEQKQNSWFFVRRRNFCQKRRSNLKVSQFKHNNLGTRLVFYFVMFYFGRMGKIKPDFIRKAKMFVFEKFIKQPTRNQNKHVLAPPLSVKTSCQNKPPSTLR